MATRMQQRRGTAAQWAAANPVLADGELGIERDTGVIKMGNGSTTWNQLSPLLVTTYLGLNSKAYDSDRLDGLDSSAYAAVTYVDTSIAAAIASAQQHTVSRTVTGAATLAATDVGKIVRVNSPTDVGITIPANATVAIPVGSRIGVQNIHTTGIPTIVDSAVTLEKYPYPSFRLPERNDLLWLMKIATDTWIVDAGVKDSGRIMATMSTGFVTTSFTDVEQCSYRLRNGVVYPSVAVVRDSSTRAGTIYQLPVGWEPDHTIWVMAFAGVAIAGEVRISGNSRNVEFPSAGNTYTLFVASPSPFAIRNS